MARVFILWSEKYNTGIKEIDEQHKKLVALLNFLYESFVDRTSNDAIKKIIDELRNYTEYHFSVEEKYFEDFHYTESTEHIKEHQYFVNQIKEFEQDLKLGKISLSYKLMNFLRSWLIEHINGTDRKYISLFKEKGL